MQRLVVEVVEQACQLPSPSFLARISDLAIRLSRDGTTVQGANARATGFLGWSEAELLQFRPWWSILLDDSSAAAVQQLLAALDGSSTEGLKPLLLQAKNSGGSMVPLMLNSLFVADDSLLLLANTPLSQNSAEEILRQTQARFRSIVDSLSINLVLKGRDGRRLYANRSYLDLHDLSLAEIVGKTDAELLPADIAAQFAADDRRVLETGEVIHKFEENVTRNGRRLWTEIIKGPLRDADNQITGVQILFWDATDRKNTELALQRERYLLHTLLDNVPDSIYFKDRESRFLRISRGMAKKFHLSDPQVAVGKTDADIFTAEHARQAREDELHIMETGQPMIARTERETWPDRPDSWSSTTKLPLYDSDGSVAGTFGISRDITELIEAELRLREAHDRADRASRAKSEFLANMSHEIRTPMNGIIGMTELLSHTLLRDDQRSFVEMIEQSAQSLLRIINDILDFSKIEAGKLDLDVRPFELRRCVSHAAKSLAVRAAQQSLELVLEMDADVPDRLLGDPDRLRQIIVNLVGNAIKFTAQGEITIGVAVVKGPPTAADYTLHFSVRDTGIGIPPHKQASIFDAFSQVDVSTTRQFGGTGLGLSISSQLVEMMQGRIWLESEKGVGSTFHFTACFTPDRRASAGELAAEQVSGLKGMRLLIVDDNAVSRETLENSLRRRGLWVQTAGDAAQARALYGELAQQHDAERCALIVDQHMPDVDGLQLIQQLHESFPEFRPKIILLTSLVAAIPEDFSQQHPLAAVLQKPALQSEVCCALQSTAATGAGREPAKPSQNPPAAERGMHFLLAEDGAVNRAVFTGLLQRAGHQVTTVEDGLAAVEAWRNFNFDAILMDVHMPRMDGLQATELIRQEEESLGAVRVPVIAITAAAMEGDQARCQAAGMDDYLSKPIDVKQLERVMAAVRSGALASQAPPSTGAVSDKPSAAASSRSTLNFQAPLAKLNYTPQQQRQLVTTLQKETIQRLDELTRAIDTHDAKLLIRSAHSLKSVASLFEATAVAQEAGQVEDSARSSDIATAREHFPALRQATSAMLQDIYRWLDEQP